MLSSQYHFMIIDFISLIIFIFLNFILRFHTHLLIICIVCSDSTSLLNFISLLLIYHLASVFIFCIFITLLSLN